MLIAWLHAASEFKIRDSHFEARKGLGKRASKLMSFETRSSFRDRIESDTYWAGARAKERRPRGAEGVEPVGHM